MGDYLAYKNVMTKEYVVFVDSTLGYEAIGRNKKIIAFPLGCDDKEWCKTNYLFSESPEEIYYPTSFAYPLIFPSIGPFWCSKYDKQKMNDILNFVTTRSDEEWKEIINNLKLKKIMSFDQGNEKLISVLDQIGVPLNKKIIQNSKLIISEDNYKYFNT
jgi:surface carbohydrate biosynthesis protein